MSSKASYHERFNEPSKGNYTNPKSLVQQKIKIIFPEGDCINFRIPDCLQIIHITSTLSFIHLPMLRASPTIQKFHHHAFEKFQIRKLINVPPQLIQLHKQLSTAM